MKILSSSSLNEHNHESLAPNFNLNFSLQHLPLYHIRLEMGYFDDYLSRCIDDFNRDFNIDQDDLEILVGYFERMCNMKSLPGKFMLLIKLTEHLMHEIQTLKSFKKNDNIENIDPQEQQTMKFEQIIEHGIRKPNSPLLQRKGILQVEPCMTLSKIPVKMVQNLFSYLSIEEVIQVEKYKNRCLVDAAMKNLDNHKIVEIVTMYPIFTPRTEFQLLSQRINHIRFTRIDALYLPPESCDDMMKLIQNYGNVNTIVLEGISMQRIWMSPSEENAKYFVNAIENLTSTRKNIRHISFMECSELPFPLIKSDCDPFMNDLFDLWTSIYTISLKWSETEYALTWERGES